MFVACPQCRSVLQILEPSVGAAMCPHCQAPFQVASQQVPTLPLAKAEVVGSLPHLPAFLPDSSPGTSGTTQEFSRPLAKRPIRSDSSALNMLIVVQVVLGGVVGVGSALLLAGYYGIGKPVGNAEAFKEADQVPPTQPSPVPRSRSQSTPTSSRSVPTPKPLPLQSTTPPLRNPAPLPGVAASSRADASSSQTSSPPKSPEQQFLQSLPTEIDLPSLVHTESTALFQAGDLPDSLDWHLQDDAADIPDAGLYFVEPQAELEATWDVCFTPDPQGQPPQITKIARLSAGEQEVRFQWARTPEINPLKEQLRNCMLRVSAGNEQHWLQLRKSKSLPAVKLNFDEKSDDLTFDFPGLPLADAVFLEVESPCPGTFEREQSRVTAGKEVTFQFGELQGAQLRIKMIRDKEDETLTLRIQSEFEESRGTNFELTRDKLQDMVKRWSDSLNKATANLAEAQATVASLQSQQRQLASRTPGNVSERAAQQTAMLGLTNRMKSVADRIPVQQKRIVEMKARLDAAPLVERFFNAHHQRTTVPFRIVAEAGEHRILLVDATK